MQRTTIMADEQLLEQLRRIAADERTSLAQVIREALEEKARSRQPRPRAGGIGESGAGDVARRTAEERAGTPAWR